MGGGGSSMRKIDQQLIQATEYENNAGLIKNVPETFRMFRSYGDNNSNNGILILLFLIFILIMFYLYFKYSYK